MKAIVIGSSAYGGRIARNVLGKLELPDDACAIYVPHLESGQSFEYLSYLRTNVRRIGNKKNIEPGHMYIGVGLSHPDHDFFSSEYCGITKEIKISKNNGHYRFCIGKNNRTDSIDSAFSAVADAFGKYSIGVILEGSGDDGVKGIEAIKRKGGITIAQTAGIEGGMPDSAIKSGYIDYIVEPDKLPVFLNDLLSG